MKMSNGKEKRKMVAFCCCMALVFGLMTACGSDGGSTGGSDDSRNGVKTDETARTIVVEETNGTTIVLDEAKESTNAYKGMHLFSGDDVTVQEASDLTMLLDMDKYLYAEENTHFWLEASGSEENSKTVIYLDEGAALNRIVNPLEKESVYQVETPNSTMAVRGTVFRVVVRTDENGMIYADLAVLDGSVKVDLHNTEGEENGVAETIEAGQAATIRADEQTSEFVVNEDGSISSPIDYSLFPTETLEKLIEYIDAGEEISVDREELEKIIEERKAEGEHYHCWQTVTVYKADCSHAGLEKTVCNICSEVKSAKVIPATVHNASPEWTTSEEGSCTKQGLQVKICTVCGAVVDSRNTGYVHDWSEWDKLSPTCTEAGGSIRRCILCDASETVFDETQPATGHTGSEWAFDEERFMWGKICEVCGEIFDFDPDVIIAE